MPKVAAVSVARSRPANSVSNGQRLGKSMNPARRSRIDKCGPAKRRLVSVDDRKLTTGLESPRYASRKTPRPSSPHMLIWRPPGYQNDDLRLQ